MVVDRKLFRALNTHMCTIIDEISSFEKRGKPFGEYLQEQYITPVCIDISGSHLIDSSEAYEYRGSISRVSSSTNFDAIISTWPVSSVG